ncbi:MAG: (2Fe-2S)-binding protein [Treponema sp.]|nr:(2Fe-2S)-binding protein [Treponema sp.]
MKLNFEVNGRNVSIEVDASRRLLDILREDLGLTGTKEGCGEGECGACTILIDGKAIHSCLTVAAQLNGKKVTTIGYADKDGVLGIIQKAFIEEIAIQCGYCTTGMIMCAKALLTENPNPTTEQIKIALSGNICRCSGYAQILKAVQRSAKEIGG